MDRNNLSAPAPLKATIVDLFDEWATKTPDRIAAEWQGETLTYLALRNASLHVSKALLSTGVPPGSTVPLLTEMSLEMLPAIIGILRVGACYVPMDVAAWSHSRIEAALSNLYFPITVVTTPCPWLSLQASSVSFKKEWLHAPLANADDLCCQLDALRDGFRNNDLAWILFTSGTTGKPKGVMVYHSAAYAYAVVDLMKYGNDEQNATANGVRTLLAFSIGFDGCAAVVWTTLTKGHTLVMASPSSFPEVAATCDLLILTPSMLAVLDPSGPYDRVRSIYLGAEDPSMEVVRQWIRPNRKIFTTYGPSETTCIITLGELKADEEVTLGRLLPGVTVVIVDENLQQCNHGELLIAGPGLAAGYFNNPELTAQKFIQWKGKRFYRTGDCVRRRENGQLAWAGRADSLIKNRGFLINLETEVEPALLSYPPVQSAVALKWRDKLIGYIRPATVDSEELRKFMKERFDPFVIPDEILALDSFPLNINGKVDRHSLRAQREERVIENDENLIQDGHLSACNALRLAFSKCLSVPVKKLNEASSYTKLGGNSFTAIQLSSLVKKYGYFVPAIQILRLDTIGRLSESIQRLPDFDGPEQNNDDSGYSSEKVPATPAQRLFLSRSLENPIEYALIGIAKYIGDPLTIPTASELHHAFIKALSAHSIFQVRFDVTNFTLSDLGWLNLDWKEVSVTEADFSDTCVAVEEKAWLEMKEVSRPHNEIPYFHITCVSVPDRRALAYITRIHHVLVDFVSQAILSQDVDRALAGEEVPQGPRIQDFAMFMHKYEQDNLGRAVTMFESMIKPLPATSVLEPPSPQATPLEQVSALVRLDAPTSIRKSVLDASAHDQRITSSTMVYAAWALFLSKITAWNHVGFRISLSGRTVPWPSAQSIVGAVANSAPFSTAVPTDITVHEWLAQVHKTILDILEFDGIFLSLPDSIRSDRRTNTTIVLCFLDVPEASTPNWSYSEKQQHSYLMDWHIFQEGGVVMTKFEFQSGLVHPDWAKEVAGIPGRILEGILNATSETLVGDLLK